MAQQHTLHSSKYAVPAYRRAGNVDASGEAPALVLRHTISDLSIIHLRVAILKRLFLVGDAGYRAWQYINLGLNSTLRVMTRFQSRLRACHASPICLQKHIATETVLGAHAARQSNADCR